MSCRMMKLKNVCDFIDGDRGKNYPSNGELTSSGSCLFLNTGNVTKNGFNFEKCQFITAEKDALLRKGKLRHGDVVLTTRGTLGNAGFFSNKLPYQSVRINSGMLILRASVEFDPRFLFYAVQSPMFQAQINGVKTGSAQPQLPVKTLKEMEVSFPSREGQERIVDVLSAYDELIENSRRQIKLLEEAAQRLYKEWFIDLKFPGHETMPIVDGLPEGWERGTLLTLVDVVRGCSYSSDEIIQGEKTLINLGNLTPFGGFRFGYEKPFSGKSRENQLVAKGDVVMGLTEQAIGLAGYAALLPTVPDGSVISADLVKIAPKQGVPAEFVYALLRYGRLSELISPLANGTKIKHLRPQSLSRVMTQIPSIELMQRYAAVVCPAYEQIDVCQQQVAAAREARDRLLPKLMSGEIEV